MADIRIKDLPTTATQTASDDFIALDGTVNGTRKIDASAPSFKTSVTSPSIVAPAATALTLTGGSTGASLVLGQGANAAVTISPTGTSAATVSKSLQVTGVSTVPGGNGGLEIQYNGGQSVLFSYDRTGAVYKNLLSYALSHQWLIGGSEVMRLAPTTGNVLIGTTTDAASLAGGLVVNGSGAGAAASSTTTGALRVTGGVGVSGAGYFGETVSIAGTGVSTAGLSVNLGDQSKGRYATFGNASNGAGRGAIISQLRILNYDDTFFGRNLVSVPTTDSAKTLESVAYAGMVMRFDGNIDWVANVSSTAGASITPTVRMSLSNAGALNVTGTTSASNSYTGALVVGNGLVGSAGVNVAIGGGNVNAGGTITSQGNFFQGAAGSGAFFINRQIYPDATNSLFTIYGGNDATTWLKIHGNTHPTKASQVDLTATATVLSSTTPSTGAGTGALQVAGGIYAGAASVFGSTLKVGAGSFLNFATGYIYGVLKVGGDASQGAGTIVLGDDGSTVQNVGVWRGTSNGIPGTNTGNVLNLGGYSGVTITTGAAALGSQTVAASFSSTGAATFAGAVTSAGSLTVSGGVGTSTASTAILDYSTGARVIARGTGVGNYGVVKIAGTDSAGSAAITGGIVATFDSSNGASTFAGAVTVASNGVLTLGASGASGSTINHRVYGGGSLGPILSIINSGNGGAGVAELNLTAAGTTNGAFVLRNEDTTGPAGASGTYLYQNAVRVMKIRSDGVSIPITTAGSAGAGALVVSGGLATGAASYFGGAVTVNNAITCTGASAAINVNGTSGSVIATVSSGSSSAGGGQCILSLNISDQQWSVRNAGGPFAIRDDTSGNYYLNITRATGAVRFHAYGAGAATFDSSGNITSVSDARLKNITGNFTKGLAEIVKLTPKLYTWKPETGLVTDDINATLIAQDLIAAGLPEAVTTYRTVAVMEDDVQSAEDIAAGKPVTQHAKLDADGKPVTQRVDANYSVSDRTVIAALVNAVKELKAEIDALKAAK